MAFGCRQPRYLMSFDNRESLQTKMFGWYGKLSARQTAEIVAAKQVIYDGFLAAVRDGVSKEHAGIVVDEQFGASILRDAAEHGYAIACPVEKSGQEEFVFEYGDDFARHIEAINPTFCKVSVRYNPEGDAALNRRQAAGLKRLSDYLQGSARLFMFELMVAAEPGHLAQFPSDPKANDRELVCVDDGNIFHLERFPSGPEVYDRELRPALITRTLRELQGAGVEPHVWKVQGLDRREDCVNVVGVARRDGRDKVSCIILGRGEADRKVREWLAMAAGVDGFIGFDVGSATWWDPLADWRAARIAREAAVADIACRFRRWVDIFEEASCRSAVHGKGPEGGRVFARSLATERRPRTADESRRDSFAASDAPGWTPLAIGPPAPKSTVSDASPNTQGRHYRHVQAQAGL